MRWPVTSQGRELQVGDKLGPYRIDDMLGEGGMGIVFRAVRESDGETVALKVLRDELRRDDVYQRRIAHEQRAAREVEHRHLVPIYDTGEVDGRQYLVMQYVPGHSLGGLVFECLSGKAVFSGKGKLAVGIAHLEEQPSDPCQNRDDVPSSLSWAVLQALEKDPARRPPSATAYATMLRVAATSMAR